MVLRKERDMSGICREHISFEAGCPQCEATIPKPMVGKWTLTGPDGRSWGSDSPLHCCRLEQKKRIPAHVGLKRILHALEIWKSNDRKPKTLPRAAFKSPG